MSWSREYFDRVRPALGELFFDQRAALWRLGRGPVVAEALARTGIREQIWFDDGAAGGAAARRSFGAEVAEQPCAAALRAHCRAHNTFESAWALEDLPAEVPILRRELAARRPAVLWAALDDHAPEVCRAALDTATPLVLTLVPAAAALGCVQIVWTPRSAVDPDALIALCGDLARVPAADLDRPELHPDGLEAQSMALALCRWLLAPKSPERADLATPLLEHGRAVILRGEPGWPWAVRFVRPQDPGILALARDAARPYAPPASLARGQRLLVIGLGTAALFCAEAPLIAPAIAVLDCKAVSPFNPVRQPYSVSQIGEPKGRALVDTLRRRLAPGASWTTVGAGPLTVASHGTSSLAWAELELAERDASAMRRFHEILDEWRPTLAIVGMGRSRDVNFTATAELRRRGIRHITPTAFPAVSHYKHILTDGAQGPCYDCLQGHLAIDGGAGPTLQEGEREMFYGGTQPATLAETLPSAHSLLRLARDLAAPPAARPGYLSRELAAERTCLVGANRAELGAEGWLYGIERPFRMVSYGIGDLVGSRAEERCPCGRTNTVARVVET